MWNTGMLAVNLKSYIVEFHLRCFMWSQEMLKCYSFVIILFLRLDWYCGFVFLIDSPSVLALQNIVLLAFHDNVAPSSKYYYTLKIDRIR